ncbi:MAG: RluA family pseudouridine synthase [Deltaproteobacteria bacterium]|nr:RluA family pseudouridine synthase [Deltaproteobacteria bacterium]
MRRISLTVAPGDARERLDRFIAARGGISRSLARRVLEVGGVFVDGKRCKVAGRGVHPGQRVEVNVDEVAAAAAGTPAVPLDRARLLYVDDHLLAADKPAGVLAQATRATERGALPELCAALLGSPVHVVHRLDRETSGVTLLGRTSEAAAALGEAFRRGEVHKTYLALCARPPEPSEGTVDAPLGPVPGRPGLHRVTPGGDAALTRYRTLAVGPAAGAVAGAPGGPALVEARPETGRTHQIRVHLASVGAPVLGDVRYGGPRRLGDREVPRVMLHAWRLSLPHPLTGALLAFEAPLPPDFAALAPPRP